MLKFASVDNQKQVFDFVMAHKKNMFRTAFRYVIERMPNYLRKKLWLKN